MPPRPRASPGFRTPRRKQRRPPHIALLIETSNAYARGLLHGIRAYVREHGPWSIYLGEQRRGEAAPAWLRNWSGDGIIARIESPAIAAAVRRAGVPAVDVSAARHLPDLPYVETDDVQIARLAAEHLWERGFRRLAYCGDARFRWSNLRSEAFERFVQERGGQCHVFTAPRGRRAARHWEDDKQSIAKWLKSLSKPAGVMACYDIRGRQLLDVCRELGVAVPDEVAVIGVDNDELLCDLAAPPLSSVAPDTRRTGYEAARLLDRLLSGEHVPPGATLVQPLGVVTRGSTDVLAIDDADVSAAVRFIRSHATEGINVDDVLRAVPLSRRVLEARFKKLLGRTPHEEITRVRIDRVRQLLAETDLPLAAIAHRTGYRHVEYLSVAFKRETHQSPKAYRARSRG